ncbi:hypothetical protein [Shewanella algae]|nr:hypothetical protein [Shewanella algae]
MKRLLLILCVAIGSVSSVSANPGFCEDGYYDPENPFFCPKKD